MISAEKIERSGWLEVVDDFLVMMGDDLYVKGDIENCMKNDLAVLGFEVNNPNKFGIILSDENKNLLKILRLSRILFSSCLARND